MIMSGSIFLTNIHKQFKIYPSKKHRVLEALTFFKGKYCHPFHALNDVSFQISPGETIGIIGKNGSGKSTLLKIICGIVVPTSGEVKVDGRISALLELGAGFNPEFTGRENIYFTAAILGIEKSKIKAQIPKIIEFANIGEYIDQPVKSYSSGMFVRLAFSVSIHVEPDILIIDEALSVGDMNFQNRCFKKFNEFRKNGKTILFVTHSMDTVLKYCDRAILLDKGQKVFEGSPKEAVDIYKRIEVSLPAFASDHEKILNAEDVGSLFPLSSEAQSYGDGSATIKNWGITNENSEPIKSILSDELFEIRFEVEFHEKVSHPIFAYSIKDNKGLEITGTNSSFLRVASGEFQIGQIARLKFTQKLSLAGGPYWLSLGCTNFEPDFKVHHRIYDVFSFEALAHRSTVGFFDPMSEFKVTVDNQEDIDQGSL